MLEDIQKYKTDKFTVDSLQNDIQQMIEVINNYVYTDTLTESTYNVFLKTIKDRLEDVKRYNQKWEHRWELYKNAINYLGGESFAKEINLDIEDGVSVRESVYREYFPVIQSLYNSQGETKDKIKVSKSWLDTFRLMTTIINEWE